MNRPYLGATCNSLFIFEVFNPLKEIANVLYPSSLIGLLLRKQCIWNATIENEFMKAIVLNLGAYMMYMTSNTINYDYLGPGSCMLCLDVLSIYRCAKPFELLG